MAHVITPKKFRVFHEFVCHVNAWAIMVISLFDLFESVIQNILIVADLLE